jgi:hypothetical protein
MMMKWLRAGARIVAQISAPRRGSNIMGFKEAVYPQVKWMVLLIITILSIALWQSDFVIAGTVANIYLNGLIFAGAAFGVVLHFRAVFTLKDEYVGLAALNEAYQDNAVRRSTGSIPTPASDRLDRLREPAAYFKEPQLLRGSFDLLYSQLYAAPAMTISTGTAKMLIEDFENRLADRVGFINYVAGLMVLLGLLGTFIGLLQTVGSVGDIIASIDLTSGAGPEAIQGLLDKLGAPLSGMATGFSSSLFGLIASLALGVMTKICFRSFNHLKAEFEVWINRVSQIETIALDLNQATAHEQAIAHEALDLEYLGMDPNIPVPVALQNSLERLSYSVECFGKVVEREASATRDETRKILLEAIESFEDARKRQMDAIWKSKNDQIEAVMQMMEAMRESRADKNELTHVLHELADTLRADTRRPNRPPGKGKSPQKAAPIAANRDNQQAIEAMTEAMTRKLFGDADDQPAAQPEDVEEPAVSREQSADEMLSRVVRQMKANVVEEKTTDTTSTTIGTWKKSTQRPDLRQ